MLTIYMDAAFDPKTGEAGLAYVIIDGQSCQHNKYYCSKLMDNHQAEFVCLRQVLRDLLLVKLSLNQVLAIKTDSKIVADSFDKGYVKSNNYQAYLSEILQLADQFDLIFVTWLPEGKNKQADGLAKQALHRQGQVEVLS
ncbi:ribonuclease HI family protein [Facklamia hominis]|uniref:ribonuclease HI family protein n=1 Tax=Facklamia hominis TaxID=178214 RepID=UPI0038FC8E90